MERVLRMLRRLSILIALVGAGVALMSPVLSVPATGRDGVGADDQMTVTPSLDVASSHPARSPAADRPNVVFILLDDFSRDLTQSMASAKRMRATGADYRHSYVVDSLCCVSRASTFTGQYPHQSGVRTNVWKPGGSAAAQGGFTAFRGYGNERRSFAVSLQKAGYATGYVGKYLNQFEYKDGVVPPAQPGWSEQSYLFGSAYDGWDFYSSKLAGDRLQLQHHPAPPATASAAQKDAAYAGTVTTDLALDFLRRHQDSRQPYFLQVAPYASHSRVGPTGAYPGDPLFPPAFRDRPSAASPAGNCGPVACGTLTTKDLPGFGDPQRDNRPRRKDGSPGPVWNPPPHGLSAGAATQQLRDRARMAQSADRMVQQILDLVGDDAIVVLTSDNGFHLGQNGLASGKGSPYRTDVGVPLLVSGPGVAPGKRSEMVSNIDWAATFEELAGVNSPRYRAGRSFAASLAAPAVANRNYVFTEHTWSPAAAGADPDRVGRAPEMDTIPSYLAVRTRDRMLARFDLDNGPGTDFVYELYDYRAGFEKKNVFHKPKYAADVKLLLGKLKAFDRCAAYTRSDALPKECRTLTR